MSSLIGAVREGWSGGSVAQRLWWSAMASIGLAAVLVTTAAAVTSTSPSTHRASSVASSMPSGSINPSSASGGSMPGMSGSTGGIAATAGGICPNVEGTTVMPDGMVMAPVPSGSPTPGQRAAADQLVTDVDQGILQYSSVAAAEAAGYRPVTNVNGPMTHYLNPSIVRSGDVLDPEHPSALMFANTVNGPVLLGAMFLGPAPCQPGPDVGGPLTQWHAHDNLCLSSGQVVGRTGSTGQCALGEHNPTTYFMLHVWTAPSIASTYQFQADLPPSVYEQIDQSGQP